MVALREDPVPFPSRCGPQPETTAVFAPFPTSFLVVVARAKRVVNLAEVAARKEGQTGEVENSGGQSVGQEVVLNANDHSQMVNSCSNS